MNVEEDMRHLTGLERMAKTKRKAEDSSLWRDYVVNLRMEKFI